MRCMSVGRLCTTILMNLNRLTVQQVLEEHQKHSNIHFSVLNEFLRFFQAIQLASSDSFRCLEKLHVDTFLKTFEKIVFSVSMQVSTSFIEIFLTHLQRLQVNRKIYWTSCWMSRDSLRKLEDYLDTHSCVVNIVVRYFQVQWICFLRFPEKSSEALKVSLLECSRLSYDATRWFGNILECCYYLMNASSVSLKVLSNVLRKFVHFSSFKEVCSFLLLPQNHLTLLSQNLNRTLKLPLNFSEDSFCDLKMRQTWRKKSNKFTNPSLNHCKCNWMTRKFCSAKHFCDRLLWLDKVPKLHSRPSIDF